MRPFALLLAAVLAAAPAGAQVLARVDLRWSPYFRSPVVGGSLGADLLAEARGLLTADPGRVSQVLGRQALAAGPVARLAAGLRADALYAQGTGGLLEAQRLYRAAVTSNAPPDELAWAEFMLGNIRKVQGYTREAEVAYRAALQGPPAPWRPAALFNLAVLDLESGRPLAARTTFESWLREYRGGPGTALVLHLLAESLASHGDSEGALARLAEARALDPDAWTARPEAGYALAEVFRRAGNIPEALRVLESIPRTHPGSLEGGKARLAMGMIREAEGDPVGAARSYGLLLDEGAGPAETEEAVMRLALLGARYRDRVTLTEAYPAYRVFYRPAATLERTAAGKDPSLAQRAVLGLGLLARQEKRPTEALPLFARAFEQFPKTPESGRAYEEFVQTLEDLLGERLAAGAPDEVVALYEKYRKSVDWVSGRDKGLVEARAAEAYRALGAPALAREAYERLKREGTRALTAAELEERLTEAKAGEGDAEALRRVVQKAPRGEDRRKVEEALGRKLAAEGRLAEGRDHLQRAAEAAESPEAKLALLAEADRLASRMGALDEHLRGLERRKPLQEAVPAGASREAWARSGALSEARLRFSRGDYAGAARLYAGLGALSPDDRYLQALAEKRGGNEVRARELFTALARGKDPVYASLAAFHLEVAGAGDKAGRKFR